MPTIVRKYGLRVVIYPGDHNPPHVHIFGDAETKVLLGTYREEPKLLWSYAKAKEAKLALLLVVEEQQLLLEKWIEFHG